MTLDEKDASLRGLTDQEVAERVADGRTNANTDVKTKTVGQILAEHAFTLFNGVNLALALLVGVSTRVCLCQCPMLTGHAMRARTQISMFTRNIATEGSAAPARGVQDAEKAPEGAALAA